MPEPGTPPSRQGNLHFYSRFESSSTPLPSLLLRSALQDSLHEVLNSGSRLWYAGVHVFASAGAVSAALPALCSAAQLWVGNLCQDTCQAECGGLPAQVVMAAKVHAP